jgi:hypothetical protein
MAELRSAIEAGALRAFNARFHADRAAAT